MALNTENTPELVVIAKISGVHGIKGQVKIQSFTQPFDAFLNYKNYYWFYQNQWQRLPVVPKSIKKQGSNILLNIIDCDDRDEARKFQFIEIAIPKEDLPKLKPGEYYWVDLQGLDVYSIYNNPEHKHYLGAVDHLFETGSNDVLVVKDKENKQYLIPYILDSFIISIDLEQKQIVVDWDPEF